MPTSAANTYTGAGLQPALKQPPPLREGFALKASTTFAKGTVLGEYVPANEVQTLTMSGSPGGGTFKITFSGQQTGTIAYNADGPTTVQTALVALSNIDPGDVAVTGGAGGPWVLTFGGQYAYTDVPLVTLDNTGLTGGTSPHVTAVETTKGVPNVTGKLAAYSGSAVDGTQVPRGVLEFDCVTDSSGNVTMGGAAAGAQPFTVLCASAPVFVRGAFSCADLTGLDATALTNNPGWRLLNGSTSAGVLELS